MRTFTRAKLAITFFSDENIFKVVGRLNSQNDRFYARIGDLKMNSDQKRMYNDTVDFPGSLMVSAAVSKLGKTSLNFVDPHVKVNGQYYREQLLAQLISEMDELANGVQCIFQQDGARAHTARASIAYLEENVPHLPLLHDWSANSPDCNPGFGAAWRRKCTASRFVTWITCASAFSSNGMNSRRGKLTLLLTSFTTVSVKS